MLETDGIHRMLVVLGVLLLVAAIWNHISYMRELRQERADLIAQGFIPAKRLTPFPLEPR